MWPAAVAGGLALFFGAFGSGLGNVPSASALEGDICHIDVDSRLVASSDGQGNPTYVLEKGVNYGIVFRVEDDNAMELEVQAEAVEDDADINFDGTGDDITVRIDSETGSGKITSQAEITGENDQDVTIDNFEGDPVNDEIFAPNVTHFLTNPAAGTLSQVVDTASPRWFNNADGNTVNSINEWLAANGYPTFANDAADLCGDDVDIFEDEIDYLDDSWGFVDVMCDQSGFFYVNVESGDQTLEVGNHAKFECEGQANTAEIKSQWSSLETDPTGVAPNGFGSSLITVTVYDRAGDNFDGAAVSFNTDNCHFDAAADISPAGGGANVDTVSDTDTDADTAFLTDNPGQVEAGTAEAVLDCTGPDGTPGTATVTAIVDRDGANIVLTTEIAVTGPVAANGLSLVLTPTELKCGETVLAVATAVDALGNPVSDGTKVYFTTDTSSGVVGGEEGAQGGVATTGGAASVNIASDPGNPGKHTVVAYVLDANEQVLSQVAATYECDVPPPPAPEDDKDDDKKDDDKKDHDKDHDKDKKDHDRGHIKPPNTGDAGLAAGSSNASLFVIAGAVAFVLAGLASVRFAKQS